MDFSCQYQRIGRKKHHFEYVGQLAVWRGKNLKCEKHKRFDQNSNRSSTFKLGEGRRLLLGTCTVSGKMNTNYREETKVVQESGEVR